MDLQINDILSLLHFMYITSGIIMPIFIGIGLIGNVVVLLILCARSMRSAPVCLLQALAFHDILYMIYAVYCDVYPAITAYHKAIDFVETIMDVKRKQEEQLFDKLNFTALSNFLKLYEERFNVSSAGHLFKSVARQKMEYDMKQKTKCYTITTSNYDFLSTTTQEIISFPENERKEFVIKSIERFVGYNLIYIGLLLALCLTSERCIAVMIPLKAGNCLTIKRTRILILMSVCVGLAVHCPQLIKELIAVYENPSDIIDNKKGLILSFRSTYERFYVISSLFICVTILAFNIVVLCKIRSNRKLIKLSKHTKNVQRNDINISLLIVVLIFFQMPHYVFVIIISFITREIYFKQFTTITHVTVIVRLLYIVQTALNFVIYCLFAKRFRDVMHAHFKVFRQLCRRKRDITADLDSSSHAKKQMITFANFLDIKLDVPDATTSV